MHKGCTNKLRWVLSIALIMLIEGCALNGPARYIPPKTQAGIQCINVCEQSRGICERTCDSDEITCFARARAQARHDYQDYVDAQEAQGRRVSRNMVSFYNPRHCRASNTCNCQREYQACYKLCGGKVR